MTARALKVLFAAVAMLAAVTAVGGAKQSCFGAAARDASAPCDNPSLRYSAKPTPYWAPLELNSPCTPIATKKLPRVCWFAHRKRGSSASVALVGDSHASSWRSAVTVLARSQRWHGLTIRRSSCPFSKAERNGPPRESASCALWVRSTIRWFEHHHAVHTVFVTASAYNGVVAPAGADPYTVAVEGFRKALVALPASVRRVVVLRDTPRAEVGTLDCVSQAMKAHEPLADACTVPRNMALAPDPAVDAARQLGSPRFATIDMSDFFCDADRCHPVIGGALVYQDISHMTTVFGTSLGPYLTSRYRELP
jgi:SGNH domain-containing protein